MDIPTRLLDYADHLWTSEGADTAEPWVRHVVADLRLIAHDATYTDTPGAATALVTIDQWSNHHDTITDALRVRAQATDTYGLTVVFTTADGTPAPVQQGPTIPPEILDLLTLTQRTYATHAHVTVTRKD